uniref:Pco120628 n=1 Tax=Arundo donax TaxID=35708 RepID=A0A0A9EVR3_ARUDO
MSRSTACISLCILSASLTFTACASTLSSRSRFSASMRCASIFFASSSFFKSTRASSFSLILALQVFTTASNL